MVLAAIILIATAGLTDTLPTLATILVGTLSALMSISMGALLVLSGVALLAGLAITLVANALVIGTFILLLALFVWHRIYILEID